jgi:hypothetical protein
MADDKTSGCRNVLARGRTRELLQTRARAHASDHNLSNKPLHMQQLYFNDRNDRANFRSVKLEKIVDKNLKNS